VAPAAPVRVNYISSVPRSVQQTYALIQRVFIPTLYVLCFTGFGLLSFIPEYTRLNSRDVIIPLRAIILVLSILVLLLASSHKLLRFDRGFQFFIAFWLCYLIRVFTDTYIDPVYLLRERDIYVLFAVGVSFVPALAFFVIPSSRGLRRALFIMHALLTVIAVLALTELPGILALQRQAFRLAGNATENPISLGHIGTSLSILSLVIYLAQKTRHRWLTVFLLGTFFIGLTILLLTGSRAPAIGLLVAILLLLRDAGKQRGKLKLALALVLIFALAPVLIAKITESGGSIVGRVDYLQDPTLVQDNENRVELWQESVREFIENPKFGRSIEILGVGYPHNILLEGFLATGIVGGFLLIFIIVYGIRHAMYLIRANTPEYWVALLFIQYFIGSMFSGTLYTNYEFWCLYAGVVAISQGVYTQHPVSTKVRPPNA
jgi:O-antigen ligase